MPGIELVSTVKAVNGSEMIGVTRARTWCVGSSVKENTDRCYDNSLMLCLREFAVK